MVEDYKTDSTSPFYVNNTLKCYKKDVMEVCDNPDYYYSLLKGLQTGKASWIDPDLTNEEKSLLINMLNDKINKFLEGKNENR